LCDVRACFQNEICCEGCKIWYNVVQFFCNVYERWTVTELQLWSIVFIHRQTFSEVALFDSIKYFNMSSFLALNPLFKSSLWRIFEVCSLHESHRENNSVIYWTPFYVGINNCKQDHRPVLVTSQNSFFLFPFFFNKDSTVRHLCAM